MKLEKRSTFGWGASAAGYANPKNGIVVHFDGYDQSLAKKQHASCRTYWRNTRKFHMGPSRGWLDIGYSWAVCPHGIVLEGRGLNKVQAAQPGGNSTWYSVTFMSGPSEKPTAAQVDAFRELRAWLRGKGVAAALKPHSAFISTSCCGNILRGLIKNGTLASSATPTKEDDDVSAADVWKYEIAVPDYGTEEHPGVKTIPAAGYLRGAEIKIHDTRSRVTDLQGETAEVRSEVKALRTEVAGLRTELAEIKALLTQQQR